MGLHQPTSDRQAQTGASSGTLRPMPRRLGTIKAVENPLQLISRNTGTAVVDAHQHCTGIGSCLHLDLASARSVPQRVVEQVPQYPLESLWVSGDPCRFQATGERLL